jgi:lysylphosphatidylglycerol synthetase-like protein (DUF2156 family)
LTIDHQAADYLPQVFGRNRGAMKQRWITVLCLLGAVASYAFGAMVGVIAFVAAGMFLESLFWFRVFRRRRSRKA